MTDLVTRLILWLIAVAGDAVKLENIPDSPEWIAK